MQHDDMIWGVISQGFCSFKVKTKEDRGRQGGKSVTLCANPYNLTGKCARNACPLANSQYATVIEFDNELYLYMKTAERAHSPARMWEKIQLPKNFRKALEVLDENLQWWDRKIVLRCKQRLLRLKQILIRKRRLALRSAPKLVSIKKKEEKQLNARELKAEKAAKIELNVQKELLARLKKGVYNETVDVADDEIENLLNEEMAEEQKEEWDKLEKEEEEEREFAQWAEPYVDEYSDSGEEDSESESGSEESERAAVGAKRQHREVGEPQRKKKRVVVELEHEHERETQGRLKRSLEDW
eukprot:TRINITY_DN60066_c0_g1_i1.p2 TRINITY_DN60066_c0_g1~~TRINITY_DN60066_c0_g1_i1.p2  ORF type:complete len:332 (+),score=169.34 TRINITY_DN60066_c0_g1_i1:101-997(+)